jgi:hypothetical protein
MAEQKTFFCRSYETDVLNYLFQINQRASCTRVKCLFINFRTSGRAGVRTEKLKFSFSGRCGRARERKTEIFIFRHAGGHGGWTDEKVKKIKFSNRTSFSAKRSHQTMAEQKNVFLSSVRTGRPKLVQNVRIKRWLNKKTFFCRPYEPVVLN